MAKTTTFIKQDQPILPCSTNGLGGLLKDRLRAGQVLLGGIVAEYMHPSLVKLYKHAGFDFLFFENEHASFNPRDVASTVLCTQDNELPVITKTPQLDSAEVARLLDCGVVGIQLPRTETRGQVETLRSNLKFPPQGTRALAPGFGNSSYAAVGDLKQWMDQQNRDSILVVHLETRAGFDRAEEIISTEGVDMVYVGPADFSVAMGHPGQFSHPEVVGPMEEILKICLKYNIPFGTTASSIESARQWIIRGAKFFEIIDEMTLILQGASEIVCAYRDLLSEARTS